MSSVCVVGAQWGDEGKAGIVDLLADGADWVVRFQGGPNAGHTVVVGEESYKLHLVPCGIVREGPRCLIAQGVVVDPAVLFQEIEMLESRGIETEGRVFLSDRAHFIFEYHRLLDGLRESRDAQKIGTTRRGIGPSYADKVSYRGIRAADLLDLDWFEERLENEVAAKNVLLTRVFGEPPLEFDEVRDTWRGYRDRLLPMIVDGGDTLHDALDRGAKVLFEGAQGFLLDVDNGTYPFVTGSNSSTLGLPSGVGIPARMVDRYIGVAKAYCTRVGDGPFLTEEEGELGDHLREKGMEFGTTTGRPRRCGWFDAVAVRYAARASGLDELAITKLDILSGVPQLKVAVAYEHDGRRIENFPSRIPVLRGAVPVYRTFPGFMEEIDGVRKRAELPAAARDYLQALEELAGVPIRLVSVGPEREQVIRDR